MDRDIVDLPITDIKTFLDRESPHESFAELVDSIRKHGVLVPVVVMETDKRKKGKAKKTGKRWAWELVWGHRRLRASKAAGLETIPCRVVPKGNKDRVKAFFIENEVRRGLSAYELAILMESERGHLAIPEIAAKYSMAPATVRNYLSTFDRACEELRHYIKEGRISMREASQIATLTDREQVALLKEILAKNLKGQAIGRFVRTMRQENEGISGRAIKAKTRAVMKMLDKKEQEYEKVYKRYSHGVLALIEALAEPKVRAHLERRKINYAAFWQD